MVARTSQSARLKLAVAAGGGTLLVFLAVVGGVVGWFSSSNSDQIQHPENFMRERPELGEDVTRDQEEEEEEVEGHHVNSVLAQDTDWDMKHRRMNMEGLKGDRGLRGPPGMTVRGPPGPPGPPGRGWLDTALSPTTSCGCNQSLLRLYVQDLNPKLIPGPMGPPGPIGPVGPSGLPGMLGPQGNEGPPGPRGPKGDIGDVGSPGPEGLTGPKGQPGRDGLPGLPGPPGPAAPQSLFSKSTKYSDLAWGRRNVFQDETSGSFGPQPGQGIGEMMRTSQGEKGVQGPPGPAGPRGDPGDKGERGYPGLKGTKGTRGLIGRLGPVGTRGPPGTPGSDGVPGVPGNDGRSGLKGEKGEQGWTGPPGAPGPPGLVLGPNSLTMPASSGQHRLQKGEPGTAGPQGFKGEKGEKGSDGPAGTQGQQGLRGPRGVSGIPGPGGSKGERGEPGPPGVAPVIEIGGDGGGRGRVQQVLKGQKGEQGRVGAPGPSFPSPSALQEIIRKEVGLVMQKFQADNKLGQMKMCRMRDKVECREVRVAWVLDNTNQQMMAVKTEDGWREVMLGQTVSREQIQDVWHEEGVGDIERGEQEEEDEEEENVIKPLHQRKFPRPSQTPSVSNGPKWFPSMLRMAALNRPLTGNMDGINSINYACKREASKAGMRGMFRAFLSSSERPLENIVRYTNRNLPVVNLRGEILFHAWRDIFHDSRPIKSYWHGAGQDWGVSEPTSVSPPGTCQQWTSDSSLAVGLASRMGDHGSHILAQHRVHCNKPLIVICVETPATGSSTSQRVRRSPLSQQGDDLQSVEEGEVGL